VADVVPLAAANEETLDGGVRFYVIFSEDPRYRLQKGPSGERRWMLGSRPGEKPSPGAISRWGDKPDLMGHIANWSIFPPVYKRNSGHSPLLWVMDDSGRPFALKWSNSGRQRQRMGPEVDSIVAHALGTSDPIELVEEYGKLFDLFGSPHMPQWSVGSYKELRERHPKIWEELSAGARSGGRPATEEDFAESPHIVASPYAPNIKADALPPDWLAADPHDLDRNLRFLEAKRRLANRLVGPPDRGAHNIIAYDVGQKGVPPLRVDIDFDWIPASWYPGPGLSGAFMGTAARAVNGEGRKGIEEEALRAAQSLAFPLLGQHSKIARRLEGGYRLDDPEQEAALDIISRLSGARDLVSGPLPKAFFYQLGDAIDNFDSPDAKEVPLRELASLWEDARERFGKRFYARFSKDPAYRLGVTKSGVRRWMGHKPDHKTIKRALNRFPREAVVDLLAHDDQHGGIVSTHSLRDRQLSWASSFRATEEVPDLAGFATWEAFKQAAIEDPRVMRDALDRIDRKYGRVFPASGGKVGRIVGWLSGSGDKDMKRAFVKKAFEITEKMERQPAMVINRRPRDVKAIAEQYGTLYPPLDPRLTPEHDRRILNEHLIGIGRPVYGAWGFEDILQVPPEAIDTKGSIYGHVGVDILNEIMRTPNTAELSNRTWGNVATIWKPGEMLRGGKGISYSMGDSMQQEEWGDELLGPRQFAAAAGAAYRMVPDNPQLRSMLGDFIELHLDRPLDAKKDLERIVYTAHMDYLPNDFWRHDDPLAPPLIANHSAAIHPPELDALAPWADAAGIPVEVYIPSLTKAAAPYGDLDDYASRVESALNDLTSDVDVRVSRPWRFKE